MEAGSRRATPHGRRRDPASATDAYLTLRALTAYAGRSVRWLRDRVNDPLAPLPCYRLPGAGRTGAILVRRSDYDAWVSRYRCAGPPDVARLVADVCRDLASE